jgi:hypothetical protein
MRFQRRAADLAPLGKHPAAEKLGEHLTAAGIVWPEKLLEK